MTDFLKFVHHKTMKILFGSTYVLGSFLWNCLVVLFENIPGFPKTYLSLIKRDTKEND